MLWILLFATFLVPMAPPCTAAVIDIGGAHQAAVVDTFIYAAPLATVYQASVQFGTDAANAIDEARRCGAKVINLSINIGNVPVLHAAIERAQAENIVIVAAAGNDGPTRPTWYPAAYPGVIAVGATNGTSNPNVIQADADYSSFASPKVAAAAFNLLLLNPALTPISVTNILTRTAIDGRLNTFAAYDQARPTFRLFIP